MEQKYSITFLKCKERLYIHMNIARFLHFRENMYLVRCTMTRVIGEYECSSTDKYSKHQAHAEKPWPKLKPSGTYSNNLPVG